MLAGGARRRPQRLHEERSSLLISHIFLEVAQLTPLRRASSCGRRKVQIAPKLLAGRTLRSSTRRLTLCEEVGAGDDGGANGAEGKGCSIACRLPGADVHVNGDGTRTRSHVHDEGVPDGDGGATSMLERGVLPAVVLVVVVRRRVRRHGLE